MPIVPATRTGKLRFYESHLGRWAGVAPAIGLRVDDVAAVSDLAVQARAAYNAMIRARQAAESATLAFHNAIGALHQGPAGFTGTAEDVGTLGGAALVAAIKAHAKATGDANIYALAGIDPPAGGSPIGPPGKPMRFDVELQAGGALVLTWRCDHPRGARGTVYEVARAIGGGPAVRLACIGEKRFVDGSLPGSAASAPGGVTYQVTAVRSTKRGPMAAFTVQFGRSAAGGGIRAVAAA